MAVLGRTLARRTGDQEKDERTQDGYSFPQVHKFIFVTHIDKYQHLPDLGKVEVLWSGQERSKRKMVEAAVIESLPNINSKRGDYILAPILARKLWAEQIQ